MDRVDRCSVRDFNTPPWLARAQAASTPGVPHAAAVDLLSSAIPSFRTSWEEGPH
jgi:hypothetical protein